MRKIKLSTDLSLKSSIYTTPTEDKILLSILKGTNTIKLLSEEHSCKEVAIRQHLKRLKDKGLICYIDSLNHSNYKTYFLKT